MAAYNRLSEEDKKKIVSLVDDCCKVSDEYISDRLTEWEDAEKLIQSYQPKAKAERRQRDSAEEDGFSQLKIPYAYGLLMAQHTYLCSVFLGRSQVFQFVGKNSQGQTEVPDVETMIDHQVQNGGINAALYIGLYDLLVYGISAQFFTWENNVTSITTYVKEQELVDGVLVLEDGQPKLKDVEQIQQFAGYKGGSFINTKPKHLIVDPSVGFVNYQKGQFLGRRYQEKITTLQQKQRQGIYFNTEKLTADYGKDHSCVARNCRAA
jgi:hypothetical protein